MTGPFFSDAAISASNWHAFERLVSRLLALDGFEHPRVVGRSGDGGADVLANRNGRRWLVQVKRWASPVGMEVVRETIAATQRYQADIPLLVSRSGFTQDVLRQREVLASQGIPLQLWDTAALKRRGERLPMEAPAAGNSRLSLRPYQESAIQAIVAEWDTDHSGSALVVLATGLGKTVVAAESIRRVAPGRTLVIAHTQDLVFQLERSFWPFVSAKDPTCIVTGSDRPDSWSDLAEFTFVFATRDSLVSALTAHIELPDFRMVVVDECHHLGAPTYERLLDGLGVGVEGGPFLLGLTATPWRPGGEDLDHRFSAPVVSVDLTKGLRDGYLANVDYRMYTDNVDWARLANVKGGGLTPRRINRTLFIDEWDDAVVNRTQEAWTELGDTPRGIIFCGTVQHAERMASLINAVGFTHAKAIYSSSSTGRAMSVVERNLALWDFAEGRIGIICAVDVLNEGVDVPDVNLVVFQRVTHSRRIFVQQLGRGLRLAPGKNRVIVLDFVTDVRRFAAGLELKRGLEGGSTPGGTRVRLNSNISFRRANEADERGAAFLGEWLKDLEAIEAAGEDASVLAFPPLELLPHATR